MAIEDAKNIIFKLDIKDIDSKEEKFIEENLEHDKVIFRFRDYIVKKIKELTGSGSPLTFVVNDLENEVKYKSIPELLLRTDELEGINLVKQDDKRFIVKYYGKYKGLN